MNLPVKLCRCLWLFALLEGVLCASSGRPHIVFLVADDLGWDDCGFRSGEIKTPAIDALASDGMELLQYYTHTVCSPSRASFLTGRYSTHHSIEDWIQPPVPLGLPLDETTMAEKMKEANYSTYCVGKWHLGFYKWEYTPTFRGFDSFYGFYTGAEDYYSHLVNGMYDMRRDKEPNCGSGCSVVDYAAKGTYSTTLFTTEAVKVIEEFSGSSMFLYLAYQAVHHPAQVPDYYRDRYNSSIKDPKRRTFAGMLSALDEGIYNVTEALKRKGMWENSIIVFTTDNGGPTTTGDGVGSRNWPLRGGKHALYEGGTRVIGLVHGKGIPKGVQYSNLMHGADWLPTLSEPAGYDLLNTLPLDGVSHWQAMTKATSTKETVLTAESATPTANTGEAYPVRDTLMYGTIPLKDAKNNARTGLALRYKDFKVIVESGGEPSNWCNSSATKKHCAHTNISSICPNNVCLFNVRSDPEELYECSELHLSTTKKLQEMALKLREERNTPKVEHKCGYSPKTGPIRPWCSGLEEESAPLLVTT